MPRQRQTELDGLRAVAALLVVFDHYGVAAHLYRFPMGLLGVRLMFVLFGYFLVRQLGRSSTSADRGAELGQFYLKRLPRLAGVMFVAVAIGVALNLEGARAGWIWHTLFATNYWMVKMGDWAGAYSHFWSLSMQVQFLAIAPLGMIFLPARQRRWCLVALIVIGPVYRFVCMTRGVDLFARWFLLPASLDSFALGGLLAEFEVAGGLARFRRRSWLAGCMAVAVIAEMTALHLRGVEDGNRAAIWVEFLDGTAMMIFLGVVRAGTFSRWLAPTLGCRPLAALGVASYSLYAFHPLVNNAVYQFVPWLATHANPLLVSLGLLLPISVAVALLAHRYIENPSQHASTWLAQNWPAMPALPRLADARFVLHPAFAAAMMLAVFCLAIPEKQPSFVPAPVSVSSEPEPVNSYEPLATTDGDSLPSDADESSMEEPLELPGPSDDSAIADSDPVLI